MNSVGQSGEKKSYRVILLLVVGLTAFSSAMKELNHFRDFTREASNLVASVSNVVAPAPVPEAVIPTQLPQTAVKVEACESTLKAVELVDHVQSGGVVAQTQVKIKDVGKPSVVERTARRDAHVAALTSFRSLDTEMLELRKQAQALREADLKVTILADSDGGPEIVIPPIPSDAEFKRAKIRTHQRIMVRPEEREICLKSLTRGLNLRSAG